MRLTVLGGNAPLLKRQNRAAVLRAILGFGPLSRRAICRKTGLTASTITNIVGELIAAGLVYERGPADADGAEPKVGRPEVMVDLDPGAGVVLGAYIGLRNVVVGAGDPRGKITRRIEFATEPERGPDDLLARLARAVDGIIEQVGVGRGRVLGLAVVTVGLVDAESGVIRYAPQLGLVDVPLRARVEDATGLPVVVDNSRRAMALAEMMFGLGQGVRDFILVHIGSSIGAGIVIGQRVYRGERAAGGQIGHTFVSGARERCHCGRIGCLNTVASEDAIERRVAAAIASEPTSDLARAMALSPELPLRQRIYRAAQAGDRAALAITREIGHHVGLALADVVSVLDLDLVVLTGDVVDACPSVVESVRAEIEEHAFRAPGTSTRVVASPFGRDVRLIGSLALALHDLFYAPTLELRPAEGRERGVNGSADGGVPVNRRASGVVPLLAAGKE